MFIFYLFQKTSVTDVLKAMGAMPSGFRKPTLGNYLKQGKVCLNSFLSYCSFKFLVSLSVFMLVYLSAFVYMRVCFLEEHRIGPCVYPKLTSSNLAFRDLHWDAIESKVPRSSYNATVGFKSLFVKSPGS